MSHSTSPLKNVFLLVIYGIFGAAWLALIVFVNASVETPPPVLQAALTWLIAILGTTIPAVNYVSSPSVDRSGLTLAACALSLAGWVGFVFLTYFSPPTIGPLWLFFAAWVTALTGTAIPFVHYLNKRFARIIPPEAVMLRQAIWVGLFGATSAWLQLGRALNWASALLLAAALVAIEGFLILRDRSQRPFDDSSTAAKR